MGAMGADGTDVTAIHIYIYIYCYEVRTPWD